MKRLTFFFALSLALLALLWLAAPADITRATGAVTVTSSADDVTAVPGNCPSADSCRLRDALAAAAAGDTITFAGDMTIRLTAQLNLAKDVTIDGGANHIVLSGDKNNNGTADAGDVRVIDVFAGVSATFNHLQIEKGYGQAGAGIYNQGTLAMTNTTLAGNRAYSANQPEGGGIFNSGALSVANSTFSGNSASGSAYATAGGAIYNEGTLTVTNSTFSGNSATLGAAVYTSHSMTLTNNTFSGNTYATVYVDDWSTATLYNNILAGRSNCGTYNDGKITGSNNLADDPSCGASATYSGGIMLGSLADNGGPTQTIALLPGSAAVDAGDDAVCAAAVGAPNYGAGGVDQRGVARPVGAHCDMGAVESSFVLSTPLTVTNNADSGAGSLREAIGNLSPGGTITFDGDYTIHLATVLSLARDLTIDGAGHSIVISGDTNGDGAGETRLFSVPVGISASLENLTLEKGTSQTDGGAIYNRGTLTVTNTTFSGNSTTYIGYGGPPNGGAIFSSPQSPSTKAALIVTNSTFSGNSAANSGGAIYNNNGALTVTNSAFSGNSATYNAGGAIYTLTGAPATVTGSTFSGNSASGSTTSASGGAIYTGGTLTVTSSNFSGNSASSVGGGIYIGGGTLTVTSSTFSGNSTSGTSSSSGGGIGGGGSLGVTNSTFSGNSASMSGGGIYIGSGTLTVTNDTFSGNNASAGGSGIYVRTNPPYTPTTSVRNSVFVKGPTGDNCGGTIGTASNNMADDASCGTTGFTTSSTILLGPLGNYGGGTQTIPLLPGSSPIDAGEDAVCAASAVSPDYGAGGVDQRGVTRPQGTHCDIGAFESRGFTFTRAGGNMQSSQVGVPFSLPLQATLSETGGSALPGAVVTFTGPDTGAGTSPSSFTAITDANGTTQAIATANGTAGSYVVSASIPGPSNSLEFFLTNIKADTTTILTSSPNPSAFGDPVTFTVVVKINSPGAGTPAGTVSLYEGFGSSGSAAKLQANAQANQTTSKTIQNGAGLSEEVTQATYTFTTSALSGGVHKMFAVYEGDEVTNQSTSNTVAQAVSQTPAITTQPTEQAVTAGQPASFSAAAVGYPAPTVQWQVSTDSGATWNDLSGATATTYSFTASAGDGGKRYRAVFTNSAGSVPTASALLTVYVPPAITSQPQNITVNDGQQATFTAAASGNPAPTVQWQQRTDSGATWNDLSGKTATTLSLTANTGMNGYQFRAVFTNAGGQATSSAATVTVNGIVGPSADVGVTMTTNAKSTDGKITYAIALTNAGPSAAQSVTLNDVLPSGVSFLSVTSTQGKCALGKDKVTVTCAIGTLNAGASVTITLVVKRTNFTIAITNTATASSTTPDPTMANNTAGVTVPKR